MLLIRARNPVYGLSITQGAAFVRLVEHHKVAVASEREKMASVTWRSAASVFAGCTQAALALKGHRIRLISALSGFPVYDSINPQSQRTVDLAPVRAGGW